MNELFGILFSPIGHQIGVLVYLALILLNTLLNWLKLPRLGRHLEPDEWPEVAILVPVRNEKDHLSVCLSSLLSQDYPFFSVWVLDDESNDGSAEIVRKLASQNSRLHLLMGKPLPADWLGKSWACKQLVEAAPATAELLLFVDADTWHAPNMLRLSVAALLAEKADMLSVLPKQVMKSAAELLTVPILPWSLLSHFPIWLMQKLHWPALAAAVGQHMLWRREAYQEIGGHSAVRSEVAEDMALARLAAEKRLRILLLPGPRQVFCRMYKSLKEALEGFGKNLFAVFNRRWLTYIFIWLWLGVAFISPLIALLGRALQGWPFSPALASISLMIGALIWMLVALTAGLPLFLPLIYPIVILCNIFLAFHSLGQTLSHRTRWKGRPLK